MHENDRSRRRGRRVLAFLAGLITAIASVVTPASASPTTLVLSAMDRCLQGFTPNVDVTIDHPGNVPSVGYPNVADQPNVLYPGDVFDISSDGSVRIDFWGASFGPAGKSGDFAGAGYPFPGYPKYSSIIRFNNNPSGWVGSPDLTVYYKGCHQWTSPYPVRLGFIVNDDNVGDNGGYWHYRIRHYRA
ncbi:hypothetical protein LZG04_41070 [Saccharothrix sp. S26]|uniref:hypothetical protein n=1 Tax=Saccharothrix sp. S26 TaxID=2907215 RepID=UPI001F327DEB|nr:hypothetical protein [Saccharothrix sp. S26]MCE7001168.1 hypothetical protein [Saccharothrix sp. S26]